MSFDTFLVHDVVILTPGEDTDRYGADVRDWTDPQRTSVKAWVGPPTTATEDQTDGDSLIWVRALRLPAGTTITGRHRVEYESEVYEVTGPAWTARTPRGGHHVHCRIQLVQG